jgi:hypothetical protein
MSRSTIRAASGRTRNRDWIGIDATNDGREWFEHVSPQLGMAGESLGSNVLVDARDRLWTSTAIFDPATRQLHRLHRADGLDVGNQLGRCGGADALGPAALRRHNGLGVVDPEEFKPWSFRPEVLITEVTVDGRRMPQAAVGRELDLQADEARFDIEFSTTDFPRRPPTLRLSLARQRHRGMGRGRRRTIATPASATCGRANTRWRCARPIASAKPARRRRAWSCACIRIGGSVVP